nr:YncE family protein [Verticiella sp. GG226]
MAVQAEIVLDRKAFGINIDDAADRLYVGNTVDTSVTVVDIANNRQVGIVQLQEKTTGEDGKSRYTHDLRELVPDPANHRLYVSGHGEKSVLFVVDTQKLEVVNTIEGLGGPKAPGLAFDADNNRVYASNLQGELLTIDPVKGDVVQRVKTSAEQPMNIVVDRAAKRLYVTDQGASLIRDYQIKSLPGFESKHPGNRVVVFEADSGKEVASIETDEGPLGLLLDAPRKRLYVTNREAGTVTVFDSESHARLHTIEVPDHPNSLALDAANNVLYVTIKNGDKAEKTANESVARIALPD